MLASLVDLTDADRVALFRLVTGLRLALTEGVTAAASANVKARRRQIDSLRAILQVSNELALPPAKKRKMSNAVAGHRQYAALGELALGSGFAEWHVSQRAMELGRRLVHALKREREDIEGHIKGFARDTLHEMSKAALGEAHSRTTTLPYAPALRARHVTRSTQGVALEQQLTREWARLPLNRVRQCQWDGCGRFFLARTSERDCSSCARAFSRDTRSRVRRGETIRPRIRTKPKQR